MQGQPQMLKSSVRKAKKAKDAKKPSTKISWQEFAEEIRKDLPYLLTEFPVAITIPILHEYYGECRGRILSVLGLLHEQGSIVLQRSPTGMYFFTAIEDPEPLSELTQLQRDILYIVMKACKKGNAYSVATDYTQLCRITNRFQGALRSTVVRLHDLDYLTIETPAQSGKSRGLVLAIGPKLKKVFEDYKINKDPS